LRARNLSSEKKEESGDLPGKKGRGSRELCGTERGDYFSSCEKKKKKRQFQTVPSGKGGKKRGILPHTMAIEGGKILYLIGGGKKGSATCPIIQGGGGRGKEASHRKDRSQGKSPRKSVQKRKRRKKSSAGARRSGERLFFQERQGPLFRHGEKNRGGCLCFPKGSFSTEQEGPIPANDLKKETTHRYRNPFF